MKQTKKYPAPQISEAVFRGRNSLYNFEVYPMNVQFNEVPAVYIISRRKIDRHGRGHHFLVCIGQTESLVEDIKKHKRGKCVKQLQANTVSVILEDDARKRMEVEIDLKSAHTIPCHHDASDAEFVLKPFEKAVSQKAKPEAPEAKKETPAPQNESPAKPGKKPVEKQSEVNAEVKIEASKPKKARQNSVENKVKADSEKIIKTAKKQKAEKKPDAIKSKKTVQADKKPIEKKAKTKIQKPKSAETEISKAKKSSGTDVSKAKKSPANISETKADKKTAGKKVEIPKPKKAGQIKVERKPSKTKTAQALKKSTVIEAKPKAPKVKAEAPKSKGGAQKINKTQVGKAEINQAKTVERQKKTVEKNTIPKLPKPVQALKKADDKKVKDKIKTSSEAKIKSKTGKTKSGAQAKPAKPEKITRTKTPVIAKPEKLSQIKTIPAKAKVKTETPKRKTTASPKVKANTKAEISIKPSVKGKENRLKTSSRKRLAF